MDFFDRLYICAHNTYMYMHAGVYLPKPPFSLQLSLPKSFCEGFGDLEPDFGPVEKPRS